MPASKRNQGWRQRTPNTLAGEMRGEGVTNGEGAMNGDEDDGDGGSPLKQEIFSAAVQNNYPTLGTSSIVPCVVEELRRLKLLTADFENGVDFMTGTTNKKYDLCTCKCYPSRSCPQSRLCPPTFHLIRNVPPCANALCVRCVCECTVELVKLALPAITNWSRWGGPSFHAPEKY